VPDYPKLFLGIDPGASGGIAVIGDGFIEVHTMPETEDDIVDLLRDLPIHRAVMEFVTPMPKQGLGSTWKFGQHYGTLRGILAALHVPREFVRPQKWQAAMGIAKRGEKTKVEHKNATKARAQQLFPSIKFTHATADAALLAEYGRRTFN